MHLYDFTVTDIKEEKIPLKNFAGQVLLIVNTASKCGFTPQLEGLEKLYRQYRDQGFTVLGFPCNQFAGQDPKSNQEIAGFCQKNYGVSFPMFAKIEVNGVNAEPLFNFLKDEKRGFFGRRIKWNFTKFLVNRSGKVVKRYAPATVPAKIAPAIAKLLS